MVAIVRFIYTPSDIQLSSDWWIFTIVAVERVPMLQVDELR